METHREHVRHRHHVMARLSRMLAIVRDCGWLTTVEYQRMAGYPSLPLARCDLDRLWALGLVTRFKNPDAREWGFSPNAWHWAPVPDEGGDEDEGPFTRTIAEALGRE